MDNFITKKYHVSTERIEEIRELLFAMPDFVIASPYDIHVFLCNYLNLKKENEIALIREVVRTMPSVN